MHSDNDEDDKNENSVVILPGPLDIIMESGRHNKNNPVNIQLKNLIDTYYDLYNATKPKKKNQRWYVIYSNKYALGSWFLVQDKDKPNQWRVAPYTKSHKKVTHNFQNMRQKVALTTAATTTTDTID